MLSAVLLTVSSSHAGCSWCSLWLIGLEDNSGVVSMLRRRSSDAKINVRKASLLAIENICRLDRQNVNEQVTATSTVVCLSGCPVIRSCVWRIATLVWDGKTVLSMAHANTRTTYKFSVHLSMVALWNRADHYIFILSFVLLLFSSPNLSRHRLDVCLTSTHGVALVRI